MATAAGYKVKMKYNGQQLFTEDVDQVKDTNAMIDADRQLKAHRDETLKVPLTEDKIKSLQDLLKRGN